MESYYEVYLGNKQVGKVQIIQQGLYRRVICRCRMQDTGIYRLYAVFGGRQENIGVIVPDGEGWILDKKIPEKRLRGDIERFVLSDNRNVQHESFVAISPEEPFLYIDRLKNAFLESENGRIGVRIQQHPDAI